MDGLGSSAPQGTLVFRESEPDGVLMEFRSASAFQKDFLVRRLGCLSFHWMPHRDFPNLCVAQLLCQDRYWDNFILLSDATDPVAVAAQVGSALMSVAVLFWSENGGIMEAMGVIVKSLRMMVGWAPFDPLEWEPPRWESLRGMCPWRARVAVSRFRESLVKTVEGGEPTMEFEEMEMVLARVKSELHHESAWNVFSGDSYPPFPVFLPLGLFGCVKVPPSPDGEVAAVEAAVDLLGTVPVVDPASLAEDLSNLQVVDEVGAEEEEEGEVGSSDESAVEEVVGGDEDGGGGGGAGGVGVAGDRPKRVMTEARREGKKRRRQKKRLIANLGPEEGVRRHEVTKRYEAKLKREAEAARQREQRAVEVARRRQEDEQRRAAAAAAAERRMREEAARRQEEEERRRREEARRREEEERELRRVALASKRGGGRVVGPPGPKIVRSGDASRDSGVGDVSVASGGGGGGVRGRTFGRGSDAAAVVVRPGGGGGGVVGHRGVSNPAHGAVSRPPSSSSGRRAHPGWQRAASAASGGEAGGGAASVMGVSNPALQRMIEERVEAAVQAHVANLVAPIAASSPTLTSPPPLPPSSRSLPSDAWPALPSSSFRAQDARLPSEYGQVVRDQLRHDDVSSSSAPRRPGPWIPPPGFGRRMGRKE